MKGRSALFVTKASSAAIAVLMAQALLASPSGAVTVGEVQSWCEGYPDTAKKGLCEGYLTTIADGVRKDDPVYNMGRKACVPPQEPVANIVKVFLDFTAKNPQARSQQLGPAFGTALQRQYPCR